MSGFAIWLTGLPGSGKTTIARGLAAALDEVNGPVEVLDSDKLRRVLTPNPTYSEEERDWFYRVLVYIARLLTQNGVGVIIAATAHRQAYRNAARQAIPRFVEVFVRCSLDTCMARDQKGIYDRAVAGQAHSVPGLQVPYQAPAQPEVVVDTETHAPDECVRAIMVFLTEAGLLPRSSNAQSAVVGTSALGRDSARSSESRL
jgi:adenylylsulfate kinase